MKRFLRLPLALFVLLLSACSPGTMIERLADDAKEAIARDYLRRLAEGDPSLVSEFEASLRNEQLAELLAKMRAILPAETPSTVNLVGYQVNLSSGIRSYNVTYQFSFDSQWVLSNAAWIEHSDGKREIIGMGAHPLPEPLQKTHALSLERATPRHFAFMAGAAINLAFVLLTLMACIRTPMPRRKWLWIIVVLLGVTSLSLNWTSGEIGFQPLSILLFSAGASASSIYSPWTISLALPIGAILFWIKRPGGPRATHMASNDLRDATGHQNSARPDRVEP